MILRITTSEVNVLLLFSAMEEYDATYDSDDEVDFSKMDMVREMLVLFPDPPSKRKGGLPPFLLQC